MLRSGDKRDIGNRYPVTNGAPPDPKPSDDVLDGCARDGDPGDLAVVAVALDLVLLWLEILASRFPAISDWDDLRDELGQHRGRLLQTRRDHQVRQTTMMVPSVSRRVAWLW